MSRLGFGLGFGNGGRLRAARFPSVFDGGTITAYTGSTAADAGDALATGTLPSVAFGGVDASGYRAKSGHWILNPATLNGTIRGLYLRSVDGLSTAFLTVSASGGGGEVIIDFAAIRIGDVITVVTLSWYVGTAPVYNPATGTLLFVGDSSDSHYSSVATAGALPLTGATRFIPTPSPCSDGSPVNTTACQIVAGKNGVGKALKVSFPFSLVQQGGGWVISLLPIAAPATASHYLRALMRFSGTLGQDSIKFCRIEVVPGVGGGGMVQYSTHDSSPFASSRGKINYWQAYNNAYTDEASAYPLGHDQATQPRGPYFDDMMNDGLFHEIIFGYKTHSAPGVYDGFQRLWIDGTKIVDLSASGVGVTPSGGEKQWCGPEQLAAMLVNKTVDTQYGAEFGGVMSTTSQPDWAMEVNVGDGDVNNPDSVLWWFE